VKPFCAVVLAVLVLPGWGAAQENSEQTIPSSQASAWFPRRILGGSARVVGAPVRGLGKLIKGLPTTAPPDQTEPTGFTAFAQIQGRSTPLGMVLSGVVDVGYDFNSHLGGDVGLPVFFVRSPFSLVANRDWRYFTLFGDPYVDVRYKTGLSGLKFTSILTGTVPASNSQRIFSTGRFGVDLFNHVEHGFKGFTPFLNFGAANQTVSRYVLPRPYSFARPYQSLGFVSDFEGGTSIKIFGGFKIGGSMYALVPAGPQKVFSRLIAPDSPVVGPGDHNRYFNSAFETIGPSRIARDNGYSGWLEVTRVRNVTLQIGYSRSVHYAYDSLTLLLSFDGTSLFRRPSQ
jgi:hypothetical protein